MAHTPIERTQVFQRFDGVSRSLWEIVVSWDHFSKRTCGEQLMRSIDSVGANLVEGDGRYSDAEAIHFFEYARGSAREARFWLTKAIERNLVGPELGATLLEAIDHGTQMLNSLISYRRKNKNVGIVREEVAAFGSTNPNAERLTPNAPNSHACSTEDVSL